MRLFSAGINAFQSDSFSPRSRYPRCQQGDIIGVQNNTMQQDNYLSRSDFNDMPSRMTNLLLTCGRSAKAILYLKPKGFETFSGKFPKVNRKEKESFLFYFSGGFRSFCLSAS